MMVMKSSPVPWACAGDQLVLKDIEGVRRYRGVVVDFDGIVSGGSRVEGVGQVTW